VISTVAVLLEQRRLEGAADLPETPTLTEEPAGFQARVTAAGHDQYGAWREGQHDDLVLAVVLACWHGEHAPSRPRQRSRRPIRMRRRPGARCSRRRRGWYSDLSVT